MHRRFGIALVALIALLMLFAAACTPYVTPQGAAPLRYRDDVFSNVKETDNVQYGPELYANSTPIQTLDIYEPSGDTATKRPAIVWVHGGSFGFGSSKEGDLVIEANSFAKKGYFNVSINYTLTPDGCSASAPTTSCLQAIVAAQNDAQAAVRWLRKNAAQYRIDTNRIAIGGTSAGAITAFQVGYNAENPGSAGNPGYSSAVRAVVSLSGALVLGNISAGDPSCLDFHSTNDPLVPFQWAVNTVNKAHAAGVRCYLTNFGTDGHVPFVKDGLTILEQTRNFLYFELDAAHAAR
jgi:para-nitrobenzyl esterase